MIPGTIPLSAVDFWFQDEARFGQQNATTKLWATKGSRPRAVRQQQFEYAHLFGAVCPSTGATEAIVAPVMNMDVMEQHLSQISKATKPGRHAVIIADGASWHQDRLCEKFGNISLLKLPPYSPELNPIEQVWQWIRQHELSNRVFKNYNDIVDCCCEAWNSFISDVERVKKMCFRDWLKVGS